MIKDEAARASRRKRSTAALSLAKLSGQKLERDKASKERVFGLIDDSHATAADLFQVAVMGDARLIHEVSRKFRRISDGARGFRSEWTSQTFASYDGFVTFFSAPQPLYRHGFYPLGSALRKGGRLARFQNLFPVKASEKLDQLCDHAGPSGLVAGPQTGTVIAVEVL